jgi:hypothetical protein
MFKPAVGKQTVQRSLDVVRPISLESYQTQQEGAH